MTSKSPCFDQRAFAEVHGLNAPATRGRMSTRSTASSRPENSSQVSASCGSTVATETGTAECPCASCASAASTGAVARSAATTTEAIRPFRSLDLARKLMINPSAA